MLNFTSTSHSILLQSKTLEVNNAITCLCLVTYYCWSALICIWTLVHVIFNCTLIFYMINNMYQTSHVLYSFTIYFLKICHGGRGVYYGFFKMVAENFAGNRVFSFSQLFCLFWKKNSSEIHVFRSDQFSLLMYCCLLPSSATVKIDYEENMENACYATNDDTKD